MTSYGQQKDRARSAAAEFDIYLAKPVDLTRLNTLLGRFLAAQKSA